MIDEKEATATATESVKAESLSPEETKPTTEPETKKVISSSLDSNPMEGKMYYDPDVRQALETSIELNLPALLIGETGTGKTSFIRELAHSARRELIRINLTGQTGVDELIGKHLARTVIKVVDGKKIPVHETYWVDGLLVTALRKGMWVVLDEINMALPEILSKLHSLLDDDRKLVLIEKDGEVIRPAEGFRFFATMNPSDEYAGTKELNKAFLSRFPVVINVTYSPDEVDILIDRTKIPSGTASQLVLIANNLRKHKAEDRLTYVCSTRDLIATADLIAAGMNSSLAIKLAIINKAPAEEQAAIAKLVGIVTGHKIKIEEGMEYKSLDELMEKAKQFGKIEKDYKDQIAKLTTVATEAEKEKERAKTDLVDVTMQLEKEKKKVVELKTKVNNFLTLVEKSKKESLDDE